MSLRRSERAADGLRDELWVECRGIRTIKYSQIIHLTTKAYKEDASLASIVVLPLCLLSSSKPRLLEERVYVTAPFH